MLDASTQAHVAAVITAEQQRTGLGVLLISHDPALMNRWADRIHDLSPDPAPHRESGQNKAGHVT